MLFFSWHIHCTVSWMFDFGYTITVFFWQLLLAFFFCDSHPFFSGSHVQSLSYLCVLLVVVHHPLHGPVVPGPAALEQHGPQHGDAPVVAVNRLERREEKGWDKPPQPPVVVCKNGSSVGICTRCTHVFFFARLGANLHAQSVISNKISASEPSRKFIKSALSVGLKSNRDLPHWEAT